MNFDFITSAFAQTGEPAAQKSAPMWPMLIAIFAVFYFFIIRPQKKKQQETQSMLESVQKGSKVVTIGGIYGTVLNIKKKGDTQTDDDIIVLKVSDNTKLEMIRSSISKVITKTGEDTKE